MSITAELDVDRSLINPRFDTYRLKRDIEWNTTYSVLPGETRVQRFELAEHDYSYTHMAMATSINHLHQDPHHLTNLYLIDSKGCIISCTAGGALKTLFHIPGYDSNSYASLAFPSKTLALVLLSTRSDSFSSEIFVVQRNFPSADCESWDRYDSFTPPESFYSRSQLAQASHLHMFDACTLDEDEQSVIFVCGSINQKERVGTKSPFCTVLHWVTLTKDDDQGWVVREYRRLVGDALRSDWLKMAQIDKTSRNLTVVGEGRFKLEHVIDVSQKATISEPILASGSGTNSSSTPHQVLFSQTSEEVTLRLCLSPATNPKRDLQISVDFRPKYLKISLKGNGEVAFEELYLEGELEQSIVPDGSTWTFSKDAAGLSYLEITLEKYSKGLSWFGTVVNVEHSTLMNCRIMIQPGHLGMQPSEEMELEPQRDDDQDRKEKIANIESGLEECDFQDAYTSLVLTCRDLQSGSVCREYDLSSNQWLCHLPRVSAFVMRHDVDAFIYRLTSQDTAKHVATFDALGYIQASKTNKRFLTFTDQFSHAVIANAERQVYIYWKTSDVNVGNHAIFNLDCKESIHGLHTVGSELYILTESRLYRLLLESHSQ